MSKESETALSPHPDLQLLRPVPSSAPTLGEMFVKQQLTYGGETQLNLYVLKVGVWQKRTDEVEGQMAMQLDQKQKYLYLNFIFILENEWCVF